MTDPIVTKLIELATTGLDPRPDPALLAANTPLFEGGLGLDSFAVVELVSLIEQHFDIEFSDADFVPENFADLATLGSVVARYCPA